MAKKKKKLNWACGQSQHCTYNAKVASVLPAFTDA